MKLVIRKPLVTEKSTILHDKGVYSFEVDMKADKPEIRDAIEKAFGVKVKAINTLICRGRAKANKFGMGKTPKWKKAVVSLMPGEKIRLFEGA